MKISVKIVLGSPDYVGHPRVVDLAVTRDPSVYCDDLTPAEARRLSAALALAADLVDEVGDGQAEIDRLLAPPAPAADAADVDARAIEEKAQALRELRAAAREARAERQADKADKVES